MRRDAELETIISVKFSAVVDALDERGRRLWAAAESDAIGYGGDALVSAATGLSRDTIRAAHSAVACRAALHAHTSLFQTMGCVHDRP